MIKIFVSNYHSSLQFSKVLHFLIFARFFDFTKNHLRNPRIQEIAHNANINHIMVPFNDYYNVISIDKIPTKTEI